jgi:protein-tyrosine phosphatase
MSKKKKILFVCLGNICRSPTGEGILRKLAIDRNLANQLEIDSAGTGDWHVGEPPDLRMQDAARACGYELAGKARQIQREDLEKYDLILAMDSDNLRGILSLDGEGRHHHKIKLFCDYHPDPRLRVVPDPYYGGKAGFKKVIEIIEAGCHKILDEIETS